MKTAIIKHPSVFSALGLVLLIISLQSRNHLVNTLTGFGLTGIIMSPCVVKSVCSSHHFEVNFSCQIQGINHMLLDIQNSCDRV
ncbi:hypothetical protein EDC04DRAFT_561888 [Pisolithus marmoratus]|nr:hypothetical protein EDC04DRAFT_561888 [Pisolithus marmoratus]